MSLSTMNLRLPDSVTPYLAHFTNTKHRAALCVFAASLGTLGLLLLRSDKRQILPSPRETALPGLSKEEIVSLPYPPDAFPGARDVDSPYGTIRVYEWGPEKGPKVLLIHGISTPSIALGGIARKLVKKGCRVMVYDLFGRGYSSAPSPEIYRYDSSLYTTQILLTLQSSPIHWKSFSLIGYSLGGAIAADFTSYFPTQVNNLFLIAPGGLIRTSHITWKSRLLYSTSSLIPEWFVKKLIARRLWTGSSTTRTLEPESDTGLSSDKAEKKAEKEKEREKKSAPSTSSAVYLSSHHRLLPTNPASTVGAVVDWQISHHAGFIPSFISSIRYGPIHGQHARWRIIGDRLKARAGATAGDTSFQLPGSWRSGFSEKAGLKEVHLIVGEKDPIIVGRELVADVKDVLGDFVKVRIMKGVGHEVAIEKADEIARVVTKVLEL